MANSTQKHEQCAQCPNHCFIAVDVGEDDVVIEARRRLPTHGGFKPGQCPNLDRLVGMSYEDAYEGFNTPTVRKHVLSGH